jgi:K+-transporting ATPase ATPase C chain
VKEKELAMFAQWRPTVVLLTAFSVLLGLGYPLAITGLAQLLCPHRANGSLLMQDGRPRGSELIGQPFQDARYFWSRPSATSPAYNAAASSGSNVGPLNPALVESVKARIATLRAADPDNAAPIPIDLVTASASGLDPHISVAAARYQVARVARARSLAADAVAALVDQNTEPRQLGFLGEPRENVVRLNLALDLQARPH